MPVVHVMDVGMGVLELLMFMLVDMLHGGVPAESGW